MIEFYRDAQGLVRRRGTTPPSDDLLASWLNYEVVDGDGVDEFIEMIEKFRNSDQDHKIICGNIYCVELSRDHAEVFFEPDSGNPEILTYRELFDALGLWKRSWKQFRE